MRGRTIINTLIFTVMAAGILLLLRSETPAGKGKPEKESLKECCKKGGGAGDKIIWESSLPQQFFSSI